MDMDRVTDTVGMPLAITEVDTHQHITAGAITTDTHRCTPAIDIAGLFDPLTLTMEDPAIMGDGIGATVIGNHFEFQTPLRKRGGVFHAGNDTSSENDHTI
jgi:hypothetical protein